MVWIRTRCAVGLPMAAMAVLTLAACGGGGDLDAAGSPVTQGTGSQEQPATPAPSATATVTSQAEAQEQPDTPAPSATATVTATSQAESLLLAEQVTILTGGGNGDVLDCRVDPGSLVPESFATEPSVWISTTNLPGQPLRLLRHVALCLHGFAPDDLVEVTVDVGAFRATTMVEPSSEDPSGPYLPPETLFVDSARIPARSLDDDFWITQEWMFASRETARVALMETGGTVTVTAAQGATRASHSQPVAFPEGVYAMLAEGLPEPEQHLFLIGYEPGVRVPIGLYRVVFSYGEVDDTGELLSQIGTADVPASGIAELSVPVDSLADLPAGTYCLTGPTDGSVECNFSAVHKP